MTVGHLEHITSSETIVNPKLIDVHVESNIQDPYTGRNHQAAQVWQSGSSAGVTWVSQYRKYVGCPQPLLQPRRCRAL